MEVSGGLGEGDGSGDGAGEASDFIWAPPLAVPEVVSVEVVAQPYIARPIAPTSIAKAVVLSSLLIMLSLPFSDRCRVGSEQFELGVNKV